MWSKRSEVLILLEMNIPSGSRKKKTLSRQDKVYKHVARKLLACCIAGQYMLEYAWRKGCPSGPLFEM